MNLSTVKQQPSKKQGRAAATERRRREILDAALKCFLQHGVAGTTIEQIRAESNASHGSIYHLFRSKKEIALRLFVEGMRVYHEKIMRCLDVETTARGCIEAMIATHIQDVVDDPPLSLYVTRMGMADDDDELGEISSQYQLLNDQFVEGVWQRLKPYVDAGEIVQLPAEMYFALIIGPTAHLCRGWLRGRVEFDLHSATDRLVEAAWKSLQPE